MIYRCGTHTSGMFELSVLPKDASACGPVEPGIGPLTAWVVDNPLTP